VAYWHSAVTSFGSAARNCLDGSGVITMEIQSAIGQVDTLAQRLPSESTSSLPKLGAPYGLAPSTPSQHPDCTVVQVQPGAPAARVCTSLSTGST